MTDDSNTSPTGTYLTISYPPTTGWLCIGEFRLQLTCPLPNRFHRLMQRLILGITYEKP